MSTILKDLASRYNFTYRKSQAWGTIDGFWFQIKIPRKSTHPLKVVSAVRLPDEAVENDLDDAFSEIMKEEKLLRYHRRIGLVTISRLLQIQRTVGSMTIIRRTGRVKAKHVESMLHIATTAFRSVGVKPTCSKCGERNPESFVMINGVATKLCPQCLSETENTIAQKAQEYKEIKSNFLRGTIGAIVGALLGSIVWVLIGLTGHFASLGGIAISFCAAKGYYLLKGKTNFLSVIIICLTSVAAMVLAEYVTDVLILRGVAASDTFIMNCQIGLLFLAFGTFPVIQQVIDIAKSYFGKVEKL